MYHIKQFDPIRVYHGYHQIKKDMKTQKRLYNIAKRNNTQHDWDAYKRMKNVITVKLKKIHNNYYARLFDTGNKRQFWNT